MMTRKHDVVRRARRKETTAEDEPRQWEELRLWILSWNLTDAEEATGEGGAPTLAWRPAA